MTNEPVMDTSYEKLTIYPGEIDPGKMKKLMRVFSKMRIPLSYEQY